jgi:TP901 family phage tail tape measure protein
MAEKITQQIGFDCGPALASIAQLNSAMEKSAAAVQSYGSSLSAFNSQGAQFSATMKQIASSANSAAAAVAKLQGAKLQAPSIPQTKGLVDARGNPLSSGGTSAVVAGLGQVGTAAGDADGKVKELTVSWGTLGRVVATQLVVRTMSEIREAISEATTSAVAFGKQVAEIQTIAPEEHGGASQISERITAIAKQFNQSLPATSESYYETLSNNIVKLGESQQLLADSGKLAAAGVTSLADANNLLTASLNGYDSGVEQAATSSAKWFEGVRTGRYRISDFANTIGRVVPQARAMGVSLDEVIATLSVLTSSGIKPSEALTQTRGAINAFAKPTEDMAKTIRELGFDTAESLISIKGWGGALQAVVGATDGTSEGISKLAPNMRGLNTFLQVGGTQAKKYADFLGSIKNASSSLIDEKAAQVLNSPSQQVASLANRAKIALTTELGGAIVDATAKLNSFVDPVKLIGDELRTLSPVIASGATVLTLYGTAAAAKNAIFGASLPPLAKGILAVGAAYAAGNFIGDKISQFSTSSLDALENANKLELSQFTANQKQIVEAAQAANQERVANLLASSQQVFSAYQSEVEKAKQADSELVESSRATADRIVGAREKLIAAIGKGIDDQHQNIKDSQARVDRLKQEQSDRAFNAFIAPKTDIQKTVAQIQRARELASQAQTALARARTPEEANRAISQFGHATQVGQAAQQSAQDAKNRFLAVQAAQALASITTKQISAESRLQALSAQRAASLEKERANQQAVVAKVKDAVKTLAENTSSFDAAGNPLSADKLAKQAAKRQAALKTITESAAKTGNLSDLLGVARLNADLQRTPIKLRFDVEQGIASIESKLQAAMSKFRADLPFKINDLEQLTGRKLTTPTAITQAVNELRQEQEKLLNASSEGATNDEAIGKLRSELMQVSKDADSAGRSVTNWLGSFAGGNESKKAYDALQKFKASFADLSKSPNVQRSQVLGLLEQLGNVRKLATTGRFGGTNPLGPGMALQIGEYSRGLEKLSKLSELQHAPKPNGARLQSINRALGTPPTAQFKSVATSISQAASSSQQVASAWQSAAESAEAAAAAASRLNAPVSIAHRAFGGAVQYHADGGMARGTDRIPAMLSAGEFVVNARATRNFLPQLQAMNASTAPHYRENGGSVTNVGDIHVHESKTPELTAQAIHRIISRGQRRGAIKH